MTNKELKQKLLTLKNKKKNDKEKQQLQRDIKTLELEMKEQTKLDKSMKVVLKGLKTFSKISHNFIKSQSEKYDNKNKK